jgi:hypothetical protein
LLLAASHAAVLDTHAKPFSSATDSAHAMFKARPALQREQRGVARKWQSRSAR